MLLLIRGLLLATVVGCSSVSLGQSLEIELERLVSLGADVNPRHEVFGRHQAIAGTGLGDLYIADQSFNEIRKYKDGIYEGTVGSRGEAPGEFSQLYDVCVTSSSGHVLAYDFALARITMIGASDLEHIATSNLERAGGNIFNIDCSDDAVYLTGYLHGEAGLVHKYDLDGRYVNTTGDIANDLWSSIHPNARQQVGQSRMALTPDDGVLVALHAPYRVARFDAQGESLWQVADDFVPNPVGNHVVVADDVFRVTPYTGILGVYVVNDQLFAVSIYDPKDGQSWLDIRRLSDGSLVDRHEVLPGREVLLVSPMSDIERSYVVMRMDDPYPVIEVFELELHLSSQ